MKTASQIAEALKNFAVQPGGKAPITGTAKELAASAQSVRQPYGFNLGLDFGTAFTKCMLRDLRQERATPVVFALSDGPTFLLPSQLYLEGAQVRTPFDGRGNGVELGCLKMALYAAVGDRRGDPWLLVLARHWPEDDETKLHAKIEALVIHYLATVIRHCRAAVLAQRPDFDPAKGDQFSVNMAVPIAHVQERGVEEAFRQCLNRAWRVAHDLPGGAMTLEECLAVVSGLRRGADEHLCAVYPEVSANVQAYIQARSGFEGLYMFVDVGAGTVDASTFIFWPNASDKTLTYLAAEVVPLGSSQIELRAAAELAGRMMDNFRGCKESMPHEKKVLVETEAEVARVCRALRVELLVALERCAGLAHEKLVRETRRRARTKQWRSLRILIGGGGSALPMYREVAAGSFTTWSMQPETSALPLPLDVEWPASVASRHELFRRMTVAYGLSFDFPMLAQHRLPDELEPLTTDEEPERDRYVASSKDEV